MTDSLHKTLLGLMFVAVLVTTLPGCSRGKPVTPGESEARITGSSADAPTPLKAEWKSGHLYGLILNVEESTQVRNRNTDEDFHREVRFRLDFNAEAAPASRGDNQTLALDLGGLMFQLIRGDVPLIHYDTRSQVARLEDDQRTTDALDKLIGSKWRYTVAPGGAVLSAQAETNAAGAKVLDSERQLLGMSLVRRLFTPHFFRPFLELGWLPKDPVKVGDSWPVERFFNAGTAGTVAFKGTCTFRGWQEYQGRRCARLDLAGTLAPPSSVGNKLARMLKPAGGNDVEKGTLSGKVWFDPEQNLPVQSITTMNMTTVVNQRTRKAPGDTSTNAPPVVQLVVPLGMEIRLKISDLGEKVVPQLPAR